MKQHYILDTELIGLKKPKFLIGLKHVETGKYHAFWQHKRGHLNAFERLVKDKNNVFIGFNSENFDRPLIAASLMGHEESSLKVLAQAIIEEQLRSWQTYREYNLDFVEYDHIDLIDVAPGVMISLKTYAGRMGARTMMDMPFHHDTDLDAKGEKLCETYNRNDLDVTEMLWNQLKTEMELRYQLTEEYGIDLRSKSDAQIAEAILKNKCGIKSHDKIVPSYVTYSTPNFIKTTHAGINEVIELLNNHPFKLNRMNGQPEVPAFLEEPFRINDGTYQMGVGGLHSTHDQRMYIEATEEMELSDFDVASYYPNIMMKAGLVPRLGGNKGVIFMDEYRRIYEQRMEAKRSSNKKVAYSLKITLNGTFGKLGNIYCSFYSPDLLLAVTITGQLNLLCLIYELEKIRGVKVRSANTDGMLVHYPKKVRDKVLKVFAKNSKLTGFEYEETPYTKYIAKDVNNYYAVKVGGGVKRKGLYAVSGVQEMKNPTMEVCSDAVAEWLEKGTPVTKFIHECTDIKKFVAIRNVKGGGVQHERIEQVDDWQEVTPGMWMYPGQKTQAVKRKNRPKPREVGRGGVPFGRVARWYMTTKQIPPITYVGSGNLVPKTEGSKLLLTLPDKMPKDIHLDWYVEEAYSIMADCGVNI